MTVALILGGSPAAVAAPVGTDQVTSSFSGGDPGRDCAQVAPFRSRDFHNPTDIDHTFLPLLPGQRLTYQGRANRGGGPLPHEVIFTVTDLTKVINGVRTRVVVDLDINDDQLTEAELAFFAQDDSGNVWSLGEYPEEYEDGKFVGAPSTWIPGVAGARAGVLMLAKPRLGTPRYLQGYAPKIDFLDCAEVFEVKQRTCVPVRCYGGVLVTDENSPLDPDSGHQRKYYAPGVGNIQVGAVDDPEGETLVLVDRDRLNADELSAVRATALRLEKRAYEISGVYRKTEPIERDRSRRG